MTSYLVRSLACPVELLTIAVTLQFKEGPAVLQASLKKAEMMFQPAESLLCS